MALEPYINPHDTIQVPVKNECTTDAYTVNSGELIVVNLATVTSADKVYAVPVKYVKVISQSAAGTTFVGAGTIATGDKMWVGSTQLTVTDKTDNGDGTYTYTVDQSIDLTGEVGNYFFNFRRAYYNTGATQNQLYVSVGSVEIGAGEQVTMPVMGEGTYVLDYSDYTSEMTFDLLEACERFTGVKLIRFNQ